MPYSDMMQEGQHSSPKSRRERGKFWLKRADDAFKRQSQWLSYWQYLAELIFPQRADFVGKWADATERFDGIYSVDAIIMRRDTADMLGAMVRPNDAQWMNIVARPDEIMDDRQALKWLEMATQRQMNAVYDSGANFNRCMNESDNDYVTFGSSVITHTYNKDHTGLLFKCLHLRDCAWVENAYGVVDTMYQKLKEPLHKHMEMFGYANLPKKWQKAIDKGNLFDEREVIRCVAPIDQYETDENKAVPPDANFISLYLVESEKEEDAILAEGVFKTFPYRVRRWLTVSGEMAGRSPITDTILPEARELNSIESALGRGIEWKIDPPRVAQHDAIIGDIRIEAGGITYLDDDYDARTGKPLEALEVGDPRYAMEYREAKQITMARAFWKELFTLPDKEMTATEINMRNERIMREAAPIFDPYTEDLSAIMENVFIRGLDKGLFGGLLPDGSPEGLPDALAEADIDFEFVTPLTNARNEMTMAKWDRLQQRMLAAIESQDPRQTGWIDNVDMDAAARDMIQAGAPIDWLKEEDAVAESREQQQEQMEAEKAEAMAMEAGSTLASANPENLDKIDQAIEEQGGI